MASGEGIGKFPDGYPVEPTLPTHEEVVEMWDELIRAMELPVGWSAEDGGVSLYDIPVGEAVELRDIPRMFEIARVGAAMKIFYAMHMRYAMKSFLDALIAFDRQLGGLEDTTDASPPNNYMNFVDDFQTSQPEPKMVSAEYLALQTYGRAYTLLSQKRDEEGFLEGLFARNPLFLKMLGGKPEWMSD